MKTIVAGSRDGITYAEVLQAIFTCPWKITEVVCGLARGVDSSGEYAAKHELNVPVAYFPADWQTHGRAAGHIRNAEMADYADALILVWNGRSAGSKNMLVNAQKRGLKIHEKIVTD
jgi:hypothetical protein